MAKLLLLFVICVGLLPVAVQAQENTEFIPGEVWKSDQCSWWRASLSQWHLLLVW